MFCSKCGTDCGEAKYCSNCGARVDTLGKNQKQNIVLPKAPIGIYKDFECCVEVKEDSITFVHKRIGGNIVRTIPFKQLYQVSYGAGEKYKAGFLCVREWQDRHQPLFRRARDCYNDETSVCFHRIENARFEGIYRFLKEFIDAANTAAEPVKLDGPAALYGIYKGLYGSMDLHPDGVSFVKIDVLRKAQNIMIPYNEIAEVGFREGKGVFQIGGLSVRSRNDKEDLRYKLRNILDDRTSIAFYEPANENMRRVYEFLIDKVRENVKN